MEKHKHIINTSSDASSQHTTVTYNRDRDIRPWSRVAISAALQTRNIYKPILYILVYLKEMQIVEYVDRVCRYKYTNEYTYTNW